MLLDKFFAVNQEVKIELQKKALRGICVSTPSFLITLQHWKNRKQLDCSFEHS